MAYIFGIIFLIFIFTFFYYSTKLPTKQSIILITLIVVFIGSAYSFNVDNETRRLHITNMLIEFNHGKTISCDGFKVSNLNFSYSSGTQTFLGLKNTKMFGRLLSLEKCN